MVKKQLVLAGILILGLLISIKLLGLGKTKGIYFNQTTHRYKYGMDVWGPVWQWVVYRLPLDYRSRSWGPWRVVENVIDAKRVNWVMYQAAKAGVAWNRLTIRPSMIYFDRQVYEPQWYWTDIDIMVQASLDYNINIVGNIWGNLCPAQLALADNGNGFFNNCVANNDRLAPSDQEWHQFLTALFRRYSSPGQEKILYYEIWNEPDLDEYFLPGQPYEVKAKEYLRLLRVADQARNQVNPDIKLIYGALSDINGPNLLRALKTQPESQVILDKFTAVSVHAYSDYLNKMKAIEGALSDNKPIWVTEVNQPKAQASAGWLEHIFDQLNQPEFNVGKIFWFRAVNSQWGPGLFNKTGKEWEADMYVINQRFYPVYQQVVNQSVYIGDQLDWRRLVEGLDYVVKGDLNNNQEAYDRYDVICGIVKYIRYAGRRLNQNSPYDLNKNNILDRGDVLLLIIDYIKGGSRNEPAGACLGL